MVTVETDRSVQTGTGQCGNSRDCDRSVVTVGSTVRCGNRTERYRSVR